MFTDIATIDIAGGNGGDGCVAWRREKYVAKGGPNGGNGGNGGSIYFVANPNTDTLSAYNSKKHYKADKGDAGSGQDRAGKAGDDIYLQVPPGTLLFIGDICIADLQQTGDTYLAVRGGRGGYGNAHFVSSTRQRPDFAELGEPGEEIKGLRLELKLVADVGIIGFPSVGKSTLIASVSAAKPKIASYEFTTLVPNLGVVHVSDRSFVLCDVPGLIEGASDGKGLGVKFLRHIERCGILLHVLDINRAMGNENIVDVDKLESDYKVIRKELEAYSPILAQKKELIILNKADLLNFEVEEIVNELAKRGITIHHSISAAISHGTKELMASLLPAVLEFRTSQEDSIEEEGKEQIVLTPHIASTKMGAYRVEVLSKSEIKVTGKRIEQFVHMTNFDQEGSQKRFRDVLDRIGLLKSIDTLKMPEGKVVWIAGKNVAEYL